MNIEELKKQHESLLQQRDSAFAVYQQSLGALMLLDHLIEQAQSKTANGEEPKPGEETILQP